MSSKIKRKVYIEAYHADDTPILGNLDGQGIIYAANYKCTNHYKSLKIRKFAARVAYHAVIDAISNRIIERIYHGKGSCNISRTHSYIQDG